MARLRIGVGVRLVGGLLAIVLSTIGAGVAALYGFNQFRDGFQTIADDRLPTMILVSRLAQQSERIIAQAPNLTTAGSHFELQTADAELTDQIRPLQDIMERLAEQRMPATTLAVLAQHRDNLVANLTLLRQQVEQRVAADESAVTIQREIAVMMRRRPAPYSEWSTLIDRTVILIQTALAIGNQVRLERLREETAASVARAAILQTELPPDSRAEAAALQRRIERMTEGESGVFEIRRRQLDVGASIRGTLSGNELISTQFTSFVASLFFVAEDEIRTTSAEVRQVIDVSSRILISVSAAAGLAGLLIFFYIRIDVISRLKALQLCMSGHATGNPTPIDTRGQDEIGDMARALAFFVEEISRRQTQLRDSEARFRELIEGSIQGIVIHRSLKPLFVNHAFARMHGYDSIEEILDSDRLDEAFDLPSAGVPPGNGAGIPAEPASFRCRSRTRTGTIIWIDVIHRAVDWMGAPAVQATVVDVSSQVRADAQASEKSAQLAAAIGAMRNGICMFDEQLRVVLFNPQYSDLWGYPKDLLEPGVRLDHLIRYSARRGDYGGTDPEALVEEMARLFRSGDWMDSEVPLVDGRVLELRGNRGASGGYVLTCLDITERKQLEADLLSAKEAAEQANRAKSQFLATMSHELRTPLNAILGFSEIIRDNILGSAVQQKYREYAGDVHDSAQHLLAIITDILDVAKIEFGKLEIQPKLIDLRHLLQDAVRLLRVRAQERRLALKLDLPSALPPLIADERAMKQIMINLLSNAIKFTPEGGKIRVKAGQTETNEMEISIEDTGIGIPADQIGKLLMPFQRVDNSTSRAEGGTGLGLALVKALTELHGGRVRVESTLGIGTKVTVHLPLMAGPERLNDRQPTASIGHG